MKRDQLIHYKAASGAIVNAIILSVHRDGEVTVEPRFFVEDGKKVGTYIGGKVRIGSGEAVTLETV